MMEKCYKIVCVDKGKFFSAILYKWIDINVDGEDPGRFVKEYSKESSVDDGLVFKIRKDAYDFIRAQSRNNLELFIAEAHSLREVNRLCNDWDEANLALWEDKGDVDDLYNSMPSPRGTYHALDIRLVRKLS